MKKRIITWMVSIAMVVSTLMPAIPGYAAEERFGEGNQYVSETADAADSASLPDATDADRTVEEENAAADSSSADVSVSEKESAIDTEQSAELLTAQGEHPTAGEADVNTADSVLKLRSIDIMYGESDDNSEGKLDKLFGVDMEGYKITYKFAELKDDKAAEDASGYELKLPEDKNAFELIEGVKLSEIAAGSKAAVYVMAEPATEDDLMTEEEQPSDSAEPVFGAVRISIIKRPVRIEIPASENICVYKPADEAKPEDTLVIKRDSEEYAGIRITPVTEYEIKDEEGNVILTEGKMAATAPALDVTGCIDGDITLDISDIDYETEGFADVTVALSFASDYDRSFSYDGRSTASVTVYPYAAPE